MPSEMYVCVRVCGPHSSQDWQARGVSSSKFENRRLVRYATKKTDDGASISESYHSSTAICLHKNVSLLLNGFGPWSGTYLFYFDVVFYMHKSMSSVPSNDVCFCNVKATEGGLHLTLQSCYTVCTVCVIVGLIPSSIFDRSARELVEAVG